MLVGSVSVAVPDECGFYAAIWLMFSLVLVDWFYVVLVGFF